MIRLRTPLPLGSSSIFDFLLPRFNHARCLHISRSERTIPMASSQAPDVNTFLTKIGRNMVQHESKFTNWDHLMAASTQQLQEMGIEPARDRRYLIDWRERYRNGTELREYKRGVKLDGGERRRKMVRAIKKLEENKERRKQEAASKNRR